MTMYATAPTLSDDEVRAVVDDVFRTAFAEGSRPVVTISSKEDFDGDPALYVLAIVPASAALPMGEAGESLQLALSKALVARKDLRFPYLRMLHPADLEEIETGSDGFPDD